MGNTPLAQAKKGVFPIRLKKTITWRVLPGMLQPDLLL